VLPAASRPDSPSAEKSQIWREMEWIMSIQITDIGLSRQPRFPTRGFDTVQTVRTGPFRGYPF
jgi:hypothetical protein